MNPQVLEALEPISMEEAVGYPAIDCLSESDAGDTLTLKHERLFLLVNAHGDIDPPGRCGLGLFRDDTRFLSHYALRFAGGPPSLLSAQASKMYAAQFDLAVSDGAFGGDPRDPKNSVHIRRELLLDDRFSERVTLTNFLTRPIEYWFELETGADFADIFEVRGWRREERGQFYEPLVEDGTIVFSYRGVDGKLLRTQLIFSSPAAEVAPGRACWRFTLESNESRSIEWQIVPQPTEVLPAPAELAGLEQRRRPLVRIYERWREHCTSWSSDVEQFNASIDQAVGDLRALYVRADGEEVISAGVPWYSTAFGRDSIITSLQTLSVNPDIARDTLRYLARHQGNKEDAYTEEQPGRIMHEIRRGEMARSGEIPHVPYYGTIDGTPLWLILLHEAWRWTGDTKLVRDLLPNAIRALEWIDDYGDLDGDGFVEYSRTSDKGLANQGWKDSGDGVPFPDGTLPEPPIALVEVQGYVHDAKLRMSYLFDALDEPERAAELRFQALMLRQQIIERFWVDELGTFALALDGAKRPIPTATSNAGHLLWSRVPTPAQAMRMAEHFCGPGMFSGWGLRTLSSAHPVFNPMSYHNGSVWPHDNAIVGLGLSLTGHTYAALPILSALHDAASGMRYHRLPELFCGMERAHGSVPVQYPVSCSPQAWAAGAFFMLLQAATGVLPDAPAGVLHVREPLLPPFMGSLLVSDLRVGGSRVTLHFERRGARTLANLLAVEGDPLQVHIELS